MEFLKRVWPVLFATVLVVSCSSEEHEPDEDKELRSFERWMALNVPDAIKHENGMYYEWIERDPAGGEAPDWGDYVEINYRGLLMSDYDTETKKASLYMTRLEKDARRLDSYVSYAHYVPQLLPHSRNNGIMGGMQAALEMMKTGDNIRLFLPSPLASTTTALTRNYGYAGNTTFPSATAMVPVIVEMELTGIVKNPQTDEEKYVNDFAAQKWSKVLGDTIREYVYLRMLGAPGSQDTVKVDSTARLYYAAYLAYDGFLIETNIKSRAEEFDREISTASSTNDYVSFKPSSQPSSPTVAGLGVLSEIFNTEEIVYGSKYEIITTSSYAYGASGIEPATDVTEVLPYQPIFLYIEIEKYEK